MRKTSLLLLPFALLTLTSCGGAIDTVDPVRVQYGTTIGMDAEFEGYSHLTRIHASDLASLVSNKGNFILLVHATSRQTCTCFSEWHDGILAPYIKKHSLLVYLIEPSELTETYGLKINSNAATLGIFKDGSVLYQHDTSNEQDAWVNSSLEFSSWMNNRIVYPSLLYIDRDGLEDKYEGKTEFTISFSRSSCPDCSYLDNGYLKEYLVANKSLETFYVIDCDVEGIRFIKGDDGILYGPKENGNEYEREAYANWVSFKEEYGLAYDEEENPAGWDGGYVPTLYHINPDASGSGRKVGDVIDGAAVLYNDSIEGTTIVSSYFTKERLEIEALSYLKECKDIKDEDKVLLGKTVEAKPEDERPGNWRHRVSAPYHNPICKAFLDAFVGTKS